MKMHKASCTFLLVAILFQILSMALPSSCSAYPSPYPSGPSSASGPCGLDGELKPLRREEYDGGRILDITHFYREDMPAFESNEGVGQFLWLPKSMKNGSLANNSDMKLPVHTGTHVDAPGHVFQHYFEAGFDVDTLDLAVLNGPALLVDVPRDKNITAEVMKSLNIPKGVRRVLFRTLNTDRQLMWKREFDTSYVGFMKDGAQWLVDNTDIKLVGIDYLSVAAYDDLIPSHLVFLESRRISEYILGDDNGLLGDLYFCHLVEYYQCILSSQTIVFVWPGVSHFGFRKLHKHMMISTFWLFILIVARTAILHPCVRIKFET